VHVRAQYSVRTKGSRMREIWKLGNIHPADEPLQHEVDGEWSGVAPAWWRGVEFEVRATARYTYGMPDWYWDAWLYIEELMIHEVRVKDGGGGWIPDIPPYLKRGLEAEMMGDRSKSEFISEIMPEVMEQHKTEEDWEPYHRGWDDPG
jgi:hypothetical protein